MSVQRCREIVEPAKAPKKASGDDDDNSDEEKVGSAGSDVGSDAPVVDTDTDTSDSMASSLESDADATEKIKAAKIRQLKFLRSAPSAISKTEDIKEGGSRSHRRDLKAPWSDTYFTIWDTPTEFLMVLVRKTHRGPAQLGSKSLSRQVTPAHYGETRDKPVRSILLLRAWCLWRMCQGTWMKERDCRRRHFDEQKALLKRDVAALGAPCGLLGNPKANAALRELVPEVAASLCG